MFFLIHLFRNVCIELHVSGNYNMIL